MARSEVVPRWRCRNCPGALTGPLSWVSVLLSEQNIEFDTSFLETDENRHGDFKLTTKDSLARIERDGSLIGTINQGRLRLLEQECLVRQIATEYLC
jgi:hypothetical protein